MLCGGVAIFVFSMINADLTYKVIPSPSEAAAKQAVKYMNTNLRAQMLANGVVKVEVFDYKDTKDFPCGKPPEDI